MITIIAALDPTGVIGHKNSLPWSLPEDMKNFKKITSGHTIIMGRKTYESIKRPLPNRNNIVVSTKQQPTQGLMVASDLPTAIKAAEKFGKDIFIIGGGELYKQTLDLADRMILSHIKKKYTGDTLFPKFDPKHWKITERCDFPDFELVTYDRVGGKP